jgi:hypothetical protein
MTKTQMVSAGIAFILAIAFISHAQAATITGQSAPADTIVGVVAEAQGLQWVPPDQAPFCGTFWMVLPEPGGGIAPLPYPALDLSLPIYVIADGQFLVDGTGGNQTTLNLARVGRLAVRSTSAAAVQAQADALVDLITQVQTTAANQQMRTMARAMGVDVPASDEDGGGAGGGFSPMFSSTFMIDTNALWLEITNVSDGQAYLNLHNATNLVYAVWSTTNLAMPFPDWRVEAEIWPTDTNCTPFMVLTLDRLNLFLRAEDWTGITSSGNTVPDWWLWKFYHRIDLSDNAVDINGDTLLYDYTNTIAPNDMDRAPTLLSTISVAAPVDIKWIAPSNLYVLSGNTATITKFDTSGNVIASLSGLGSNPSGFDVDAAGNVYVALTGSNQVWKFIPATGSFTADTNFGLGGFIGITNGISGTNNGEFSVPFDVAVSPDGGTISVSDSGNNRIQQFSTNGTFTASFGSFGGDVGQFNAPKGLTYDSIGNFYIADSGNNRIVLTHGAEVLGTSGASGTAFGQFSAPTGVSVNDRGIYVADASNNRIQCFKPLANGVYSFGTTDTRFMLATNFNQSRAVAAGGDLLAEKFYVGDTGNNRVLMFGYAPEDPTPAWNSMTNRIAAGDIPGAVSNFSVASAGDYQDMFLSAGTNDVITAISQIGALIPVYIYDDTAEYYFTNAVDDQIITFPVKFDKENGVWKISEF